MAERAWFKAKPVNSWHWLGWVMALSAGPRGQCGSGLGLTSELMLSALGFTRMGGGGGLAHRPGTRHIPRGLRAPRAASPDRQASQ